MYRYRLTPAAPIETHAAPSGRLAPWAGKGYTLARVEEMAYEDFRRYGCDEGPEGPRIGPDAWRSVEVARGDFRSVPFDAAGHQLVLDARGSAIASMI